MKGQKGFTLIELVMVIVILGILAAVAVPKFQDISTNAKRAAEFGVAGGVSAGVQSLYAANLLGTAPSITGGFDATSKFPAKLDGAAAGLASPASQLFGNVLQTPISRDWYKSSDTKYQGPFGYINDDSVWTYTVATGVFDRSAGSR
jgi:prepilin-type N-terminal cleavage/methylation domain-containing protein